MSGYEKSGVSALKMTVSDTAKQGRTGPDPVHTRKGGISGDAHAKRRESFSPTNRTDSGLWERLMTGQTTAAIPTPAAGYFLHHPTREERVSRKPFSCNGGKLSGISA